MNRIRPRLSYATVVAALSAFIVLAGGAAYAASHLGKNSVGSKQLKKNSVTGAKIKKNAITGAKIKNGAVTGAKVKPGTLTGADLAPGLPLGKIVFSARGSSSVALPTEAVIYPLDKPTFTQEAGTAIYPMGGVDVAIPPGCVEPSFEANLIVDAPSLANLDEAISGYGAATGSLPAGMTGPGTVRVSLSPGGGSGSFPASPSSQAHSLALEMRGECKSGPGVTATFGGVDIIGIK